jgi:hypothetical protein
VLPLMLNAPAAAAAAPATSTVGSFALHAGAVCEMDGRPCALLGAGSSPPQPQSQPQSQQQQQSPVLSPANHINGFPHRSVKPSGKETGFSLLMVDPSCDLNGHGGNSDGDGNGSSGGGNGSSGGDGGRSCSGSCDGCNRGGGSGTEALSGAAGRVGDKGGVCSSREAASLSVAATPEHLVSLAPGVGRAAAPSLRAAQGPAAGQVEHNGQMEHVLEWSGGRQRVAGCSGLQVAQDTGSSGDPAKGSPCDLTAPRPPSTETQHKKTSVPTAKEANVPPTPVLDSAAGAEPFVDLATAHLAGTNGTLETPDQRVSAGATATTAMRRSMGKLLPWKRITWKRRAAPVGKQRAWE